MNTDHRWPLILLAILVVLVLIGPLMMGAMMGPGVMMGPGMMWGPGSQGTPPSTPGWRWGLGMAFGWLAMLAFWGILIVGLVVLVRWLAGATSHARTPPAESPLEILKQRYARGEIDPPTYERMRSELE